MSSGGTEEGNCRLCGSYTKSVEYKWRGLCLACADRIDNWSKEELVSEIRKLGKEIWNMKYKRESMSDPRIKQWKQEIEREDAVKQKELNKVTLREDAGGFVYIEYKDTFWLIAYDSKSLIMSELNNFIHYLNIKLEENKRWLNRFIHTKMA